MIWNTNMSDVEGRRGYIHVYLQLESGLTCPERVKGEEEVDYWKAGSRREMAWDICMIHSAFMPGEGEGLFTLILCGLSATGHS